MNRKNRLRHREDKPSQLKRLLNMPFADFLKVGDLILKKEITIHKKNNRYWVKFEDKDK